MPSVQKGEKKDHYMKRCVPMLVKEGKKQDQAVAECLNLFKEKWKAKGNILPPDDSKEFSDAIAAFDFSDCLECVELERKQTGIFEIDIPNN